MNAAEAALWSEAQIIAEAAMGEEHFGRGRGAYTVRRASEDPLAWWCLTEWLVAFAGRHGSAARRLTQAAYEKFARDTNRMREDGTIPPEPELASDGKKSLPSHTSGEDQPPRRSADRPPPPAHAGVREEADKIVDKFAEFYGDPQSTMPGWEGLRQSIASALQSARLAAYADAAQIAVIHSQYPIENDFDRGYDKARKDASAAIRQRMEGGT